MPLDYPLVTIDEPYRDEYGGRWIVAATVRMPWMPQKEIVVSHDLSFESPVRDAFVAASTLRLLREVGEWVAETIDQITEIGPEYTEVFGLIDPDTEDAECD